MRSLPKSPNELFHTRVWSPNPIRYVLLLFVAKLFRSCRSQSIPCRLESGKVEGKVEKAMNFRFRICICCWNEIVEFVSWVVVIWLNLLRGHLTLIRYDTYFVRLALDSSFFKLKVFIFILPFCTRLWYKCNLGLIWADNVWWKSDGFKSIVMLWWSSSFLPYTWRK